MVIVMNSQLMLCAVYIYSTEQYRTADGLYQSIHDILICTAVTVQYMFAKKMQSCTNFRPLLVIR